MRLRAGKLVGEMKWREKVQGKKAGIRWHLGADVETYFTRNVFEYM